MVCHIANACGWKLGASGAAMSKRCMKSRRTANGLFIILCLVVLLVAYFVFLMAYWQGVAHEKTAAAKQRFWGGGWGGLSLRPTCPVPRNNRGRSWPRISGR